MGMSISTLHLGATLWMCAIIWYVQCVHYPSFHFVAPERFKQFHSFHSGATTLLVLPPMLIELLVSSTDFWNEPAKRSAVILALTAGTWALTFFVAVPIHNRLAGGYQAELVRKLIRGNFLRAALWSAKFILMAFF